MAAGAAAGAGAGAAVAGPSPGKGEPQFAQKRPAAGLWVPHRTQRFSTSAVAPKIGTATSGAPNLSGGAAGRGAAEGCGGA
jgi:hypothetical protein